MPVAPMPVLPVHRTLPLVLTWLSLAPWASAQLDLPQQMRDARRGRSSGSAGGDLVLPRDRAGEAEATAATAESDPQTPAAPAVDAAVLADLPTRASELVAELAAIEDYDAERSRVLAAQLETLGAPGLQAARASLQLEGATALATAARVVLRLGDDADGERLWRRIEGRLPRGAASPLLEACAEADPTWLTDQRLVTLLDHPQGPMRVAASRRLESRARAALLPLLVNALGSARTDTRQRALDLVSGITDPAVVPLLMSALEDESAGVAFRAAELLAALPSEEVAPLLIDRVRGSSRLFRDGAYALLALVEREDRLGTGLLDASFVPQLLDGLTSQEPFVRGASAVALAGIGFRSSDRAATAWLDRKVTTHLVAAVVGDEFHADFSSLQRPARRRLSLLTGERFGADGPSWARWWAENGEDFQARRAGLEVEPGDETSLTLGVRGTTERGTAFVLVGPDATPPANVLGETIFVGPEEAAALVRELGRLGVFGTERLPGHYGVGGGLRTLEIGIAGQSKRFSFAVGFEAPWADEVFDAADEVRERNRWQRYWNSETHASRREFWAAERAWWLEPRTDAERRQRLKELILDALAGARSGDRDRLVEELELLCAEPGSLAIGDYAPLVAVLENELFYGPRAEALLELTVRAASATPSGKADPELARSLFDSLYELFRESALDGLARVLAATDARLAADLAVDQRPVARGVAARRLAELGGMENVALLDALLEDEIEIVQAAAVEAIGLAGLEALETEVLVRARIGTPVVRAAALRAAGRLRAQGARDAMLAALASSDATLQHAAVEGLADLRDPATSALLTSFLRRGPDAPHYSAARRGLLALGEQAWPELRQMAIAESLEPRREAGLLLAEQGAAEAVPMLIQVLRDEPEDARVAQELAILTCVDFRDDAEPVRAWTAWWDTAVQDGSLAWFRGAQERAGLDAAPVGSLEGAGTRLGAESLLETLALTGQPLLVARAERELERLLGRTLDRPADPTLDVEWRALLRDEVEARFP